MYEDIFKNLTFTFLFPWYLRYWHFSFNLGQKNSVNTALIYILALILIAQNTISWLVWCCRLRFCVIAANYFFTYPYFKLNFILDGYPVEALSACWLFLLSPARPPVCSKNKKPLPRTGTLAEAEREKIHANLLRAVSHDLRTRSDEHNRLFCLLSGRYPEYRRARTYGADFEY